MWGITRMRLLVLPAALALTAVIASAQTKVAVINLQRAVLETAAIKKASDALEAKYKPKQAEMEQLRNDIQQIQQQLQTQGDKLTPQAQADLNGQGQRKQRDLQRMGEDLQAEVDRERNDILGKSSQQMQEVVKKLAEEKGLDVVVEISNTIYVKPALDLTTEAIAAYDKAYPPK